MVAAPLISPSIPTHDIQTHILLMRAMHKLQVDIQPGGVPFDSQSGVPQPSDSMLSFLHHAVQRFGAWVDAQKHIERRPSLSSLSQEHIPPLDVLMIWHAYMLSPSSYYEDGQENIPALGKLGGMPWHTLPACIDVEKFDFRPTLAQFTYWEKSTGLPFYLEAGQESSTKFAEVHNFSVDLTQAVLRQSASLIRMLHAIEGHKNDDKGEWVVRAIGDYPRYMRLPEGNYVPPVEVDIIWHTHQLSGTTYRNECIKYFGGFIGHDDSQSPDVIREGRKLMDKVSQEWHIGGPMTGTEPLLCNSSSQGYKRSPPPVPPPPPPEMNISTVGVNEPMTGTEPFLCNASSSGCRRSPSPAPPPPPPPEKKISAVNESMT